MKIAVISTDHHRLHDIGGVLNAYQVTLVEGGSERLRAVAEMQMPALIVLDALDDAVDLAGVESACTRFPHTSIVVLRPDPSREFLLGAMRAGVSEVLPAPADLLEAVRRIAGKQAGRKSKKAGKVLVFMSSKGGSGATFIATNLGYQLAEKNTVLLLDLNLQFGDALSFLHDDEPATTIADLTRDISRLDATLLNSSAIEITPNYRILAAPEDPAEASAIGATQLDAILSLAVTQYDFILLDLPRTLDPVSIKALDRADRLYTVLQAGLPYLHNSVKLRSVFEGLGYAPDKLEWIVNRFEKGGQIGLDDIRHALGAGRLSVVGNAPREVSASLNLGRPLAQVARAHPVAKNLTSLMQAIDPAPESTRSFFDRLFRRG
jgi:pilus assembly protein CpaE